MDLLATYAVTKPDAVALIEDDRQLTWPELRTLRNRFAHALAGLGVQPGDVIVNWFANSIEGVAALNACGAVGAVATAMNHRLKAEEASYILNDSKARVVIVDREYLDVAGQCRETATGVEAWVVIGDEAPDWALCLNRLLEKSSAEDVPVIEGQRGPGGMVYTSGTTGKPKGALRRGRVGSPDSVRGALAYLTEFGLSGSDVHLLAGPQYHSAPAAFMGFSQGLGNMVVVMPHFDARRALELIHQHRVTTTFMAPTLLKRIVTLPEPVRQQYDVSSMRCIVVGGAPCPQSTKEAITEYFGPVLYEFYGSTELGINTLLKPEDVLRKPGSCGQAMPGVQMRLYDDSGVVVTEPHVPGELYVRRTGVVFDGYHGNPDALAEMVRDEEWLSVGDVAYVDEEGFFYMCDRKRDMIISGGVNIYPAEIEDVFHRHPGVADVAVFGIPDEEWGEKVHAAVQPLAQCTLTPGELLTFAGDLLAGFKLPRSFSFHEQLPRDAAGKCQKRALREPYWAGRDVRV